MEGSRLSLFSTLICLRFAFCYTISAEASLSNQIHLSFTKPYFKIEKHLWKFDLLSNEIAIIIYLISIQCRKWNGFKSTDLDEPHEEDDAFTHPNIYCSEIKDMSSKVSHLYFEHILR